MVSKFTSQGSRATHNHSIRTVQTQKLVRIRTKVLWRLGAMFSFARIYHTATVSNILEVSSPGLSFQPFLSNAAVGCLCHRPGLEVEEQAGGGLEAADTAGLARDLGVRYFRQRREAREEGCIGDLAWTRRHPSEEVSEQGARGCWVGGMQWSHLDR